MAKSRWLVFVALGAIYLIWGSTYLGIRIAIETLPPFLMAGGRFVIAGMIMLALQSRGGRPTVTRIHWRSAFVIGGLMLVGGNGGVSWAEQTVPSGIASLMIAAVPLWVVLLNWGAFDHEQPNGRMAAGLVGGILGVALLIGPDSLLGDGGMEPLGGAALVGAALAWSAGSLYSRRAPLPSNPLYATGMEMLAGGALLFLVGTLAGEWAELDFSAVSARSMAAFTYLTLIGSLAAFPAYIWLLRNTTPARAASYAYVNPVVAVFLGWAVAGESLTARIFAAAAVIITAVVVITSGRAQARPRPASPGAQPETAPVSK